MKLSHIIAIALLSSITLISAAQATTLSSNLGTVNKTTPSGSLPSSAVTKNLTYNIKGKLAKNTQIVFTLTSGSIPAGLLASGATLGTTGTLNAITASASSASGLQTNGTLPVIATANLSSGVATVTFANFTSSVQSFAANFLAAITSGKGLSFGVSYVVSAVPLPSALVLFATALIALAGFSMSKKARNQA